MHAIRKPTNMNNHPEPPEPVWPHYGWIITVACTVCVAVSLGFGRFALGMLLPAMGAALPLDYADMGFVSTGNFVGYTIGVMAAAWVVPAIGERWTISGGLMI
ncbi:MAG: YbfB/YjiJ family MFS transporter, partial [Rhodospirillales bacterium]|nr:YbfB/YjiJ family MFS transporter [Rhodospirillales bacterium]